jgi:hypothetical protein
MDTLQFLSNLIQYLSWPITTIVIISLLRQPILKIILNLKKLKVKDLEMDFTEIDSIHKDVAKTTKSDWKVTSTKDLKPNMLKLAEKSPLAIVLQAWDSMEYSILECANEKSGKQFKNAGIAVEWLVKNNGAASNSLDVFYRLTALKCKFSSFENEQLPKERAIEVSDMMLSVATNIIQFNIPNK